MQMERTSRQSQATADAFARLNLLGESPVFNEVLRLIARMASIDATVLIQGETGTGKELAARAIHYLSARGDRPFVPVNCGGVPDSLIESELFGHERGAFTDAKQAHRGLIAQAEGGTLLLDEVEAMSPRAQGVLLRFLEDHQYRPVGGRSLTHGNVRVVASSNVDLEDLVKANRFRRDLLFRFRILSLTMPPLRERGRDVLVLANHFVDRFTAQYGIAAKKWSSGAVDWMLNYDWPGNIRELQNLILHDLLLADSDEMSLAMKDLQAAAQPAAEVGQTFKVAKAKAIAVFERSYVDQLLTRTRGNVSLAARLAGTDRSALSKLVRKHGLLGEQFRTSSGWMRP
ncbi:sigma-54 dependent transcriptional regulator [Bradyrhizobium sp. 26S5]|uniref:sigma-54 interaction domain-containing protein n=1 Tax=Bradyrhizobium sp. 26S5 TaxID=3139729 RepID=UPI0030D47C57